MFSRYRLWNGHLPERIDECIKRAFYTKDKRVLNTNEPAL